MISLEDMTSISRERSSSEGIVLRNSVELSWDDLPRVLYLGDVPLEESFAGSTLLYRLFERYPADRMLVIETDMQSSPNGRRLEDVRYERLTFVKERFLRSRVRRVYGSALALTAAARARRVDRLVGTFRPEAVVSVSHGFSWLTAFHYAKANRIPFHLILHDDWTKMLPATRSVTSLIARRFVCAYRSAAECYNISPYMEELYRRQTGRAGTVLPPCRGENVPSFTEPKANERSKLVVAYAGTLHNTGYRDLLVRLAAILPNDCRLLLFSPQSNGAIPHGLRGRVELRNPLPPQQLVPALRREADVLFCPSSFERDDRQAMSINLPSKLTEYTSAGLPLLVWGPPDSSAVKWATEREGSAFIVSDDDDCCRRAIETLRDVNLRRSLAAGAIEAGARCFSPDVVRKVLFDGLRRSVEKSIRP
jgi:glycosyltransferase involved in cell wall biosynthesis